MERNPLNNIWIAQDSDGPMLRDEEEKVIGGGGVYISHFTAWFDENAEKYWNNPSSTFSFPKNPVYV